MDGMNAHEVLLALLGKKEDDYLKVVRLRTAGIPDYNCTLIPSCQRVINDFFLREMCLGHIPDPICPRANQREGGGICGASVVGSRNGTSYAGLS